MGLERLACIMQDVDNLFEVDTVQNIMKHIIDISGIEYHKDAKKDISLRVITDHIRSTTFMVSDGVLPSNSGRGYVLRRLLRRAARHGRLIGIDRPFLAEVCETVIKENANAYPNLVEKQDYIKKVIAMEEESFYKTIDSGLGLLNEMMANSKDNVLSGEDAFKLQDTFGFPIDLTKEIVAENNMTVDEDAFKKFVEEARMKAKSVKRDGAETDWRNSGVSFKDIAKTEFTGYEENNTEATVVALVTDGERKDFVESGDAILVLDKTSFYAESGGQVGDTGVITIGDSTFEVTNTTKDADGVVLHHGVLLGDAVKVGDTAVTTYNEENRKAIMRNHTAAHLLQAALRSVLGTHVEQAGQLVDSNEVRFDFTHFTGMTGEELKKVEELVNEEILNATEMLIKEMPIDEAKAMGAMALFGEKYGDVVRVVKAGDFSTELCGGTHVDNTGKIGLFKIVSESSVAAGVRRIQAVTGKNVLKYIDEKNELLFATAESFKVGNVSALPQKAVAIANDLKAKEKEIEKLKAEINSFKTAGIMAGAVDVKGVQLVVYYAGELDANGLRSMAETARDSAPNTVAVIAGSNAEKGTASFACACGKDAIANGAHAGNIVREVAKIAGGSGGGKPDMAMAGGKDISKIDDALMSAKEILESMIK